VCFELRAGKAKPAVLGMVGPLKTSSLGPTNSSRLATDAWRWGKGL